MVVDNIQDVGGISTVFTSVLLYTINKVNLANINDGIVLLTALAGLIWIIYKIVGQRLDNKIKRKELEK